MGGRVARLLTALCAGLLLCVGCAAAPTVGSGQITTENRPVQGFNAIDLASVGKVNLRQTGTDSVKVSADDNVMPKVMTELSGQTLRLSVRSDLPVNVNLTYDITVRDLAGITLSGPGAITATDINTSALAVQLPGAGAIMTSGRAANLSVDLSGAGNFDGAGLTADTARVSVSGAGKSVVHAEQSLDASVSGIGSIEYIGQPRVTTKVTGAGSIEKHA